MYHVVILWEFIFFIILCYLASGILAIDGYTLNSHLLITLTLFTLIGSYHTLLYFRVTEGKARFLFSALFYIHGLYYGIIRFEASSGALGSGMDAGIDSISKKVGCEKPV